MYGRVEVVLDTTPIIKRNSFKCKGCGHMYNPHTTRYSFGKYHFCPSCVSGASALDGMVYDTSFRMKLIDKGLNDIYDKKFVEAFRGKVELLLWVNAGKLGFIGHFTDQTFFVLNPTAEAFKVEWNPPYNAILPAIEEDSIKSWVVTEHKGFFLRLHR